MDRHELEQASPTAWWLAPTRGMRVPAYIFADAALIDAMDEKVAEQIRNVAGLPGVIEAAYAMPDAHWGYGFPIGGVAAFDPDADGIVCAGGSASISPAACTTCLPASPVPISSR